MHRSKHGSGLTLALSIAFLLLFAIAPLDAQNKVAPQDISSLRQKAESGDVTAQAELGRRYFAGKGGVARDFVQARLWFQKAADQGDSFAKQRLAVLDKQMQNCDPNWSPKFDQVTDIDVQGQLRGPGILEAAISQAGGLDQLIQEISQTAETDRRQLIRHQDAGDTDGVHKLKTLMLVNEGMLQIAECRQARLNTSNAAVPVADGGDLQARTQNGPSAAAANRKSPPSSSVVDVRYSTADSRPLSGAEMAVLRDSLRWEPQLAPLPFGGTAFSNLMDRDGRRLGSIQVQWTKTVVPKGPAPSQPGGSPVGSFVLQMENGTSCGFLGEAELDDSKGFVILTSFELDSWVGLGQPRAGQSIRVEGEADLPNANPSIVLKPLEVSSTLSACMTPKHP